MPVEVAEIALTANELGELGLGESVREQSAPLARLIERARAGDLTAFDQIITSHERRVISTAWRMLGNEDDARDAAQEVFLRVYKHLDKFDPEQEFAAWLYRIIINVCRDQARKRGWRGMMTSFEAEYETGNLELASADDTEAAAMLSQERTIIARALASLSEKERAAIVLRDLEGLPTEEVARILGSSQTTVRSQICSARAKIKLYRDRYLKRGLRGSNT